MDLSIKHFIAKYKKVPKKIRTILSWVIIIVAAFIFDISLVIFLSYLTQQNLIDWKTFVSLGAVELLAAVLAKLFGIGEPSEAEETYNIIRTASTKARLIPQFSHLKVISTEQDPRDTNYPYSQYRVINMTTKICYYVPPYINSLVDEEIIEEIKLKDEFAVQAYLKNEDSPAVKNYLKENGIRDECRFPKTFDLVNKKNEEKESSGEYII